MVYRYVKRANHPLSTPSGRIPEHRVILYDKIGPGHHRCHWCPAVVDWNPGGHTSQGSLVTDHVDGDPTNNHPDNLVPSCQSCNIRRGKDRRFEGQVYLVDSAGKRRLAVQNACLTCGASFLTPVAKMNRTDGRRAGRYCSRRCMYDRNR